MLVQLSPTVSTSVPVVSPVTTHYSSLQPALAAVLTIYSLMLMFKVDNNLISIYGHCVVSVPQITVQALCVLCKTRIKCSVHNES